MNVAIEKEIMIHLMKIEDQITHLNSKIENFLGFEDMSLKEIEELDKIEEDMDMHENEIRVLKIGRREGIYK